MKIILTGQGPFGAEVLERLAKQGEQITGVFTPEGKRGDPLQASADKLHLPVFRAKLMKSPEVKQQYSALSADLGVMAFVTDIVPMDFLKYPRLGTIQYHPSLLPRHRGASSINWAIIQGETRTGLTIFWPDKGIDTGAILLQKEIPIAPDDTVGTIYFNKLFPMGVDAMAEAVNLVKQGTAPRIVQDESKATYEGLCEEKDALIDWAQPAQKVYNLIRGTNPQPGSYTLFQGKKLKIFDSAMSSGSAKGKPGEVLEISASGIRVASKGGEITIKRVQPDAAAKMDAKSFAESAGVKSGTVLGGAH